jgi:bifunctional DNase/RNase
MQCELLIHDVEWCRHGHPILVLKERQGQRKVAIAVSPEDAQDLLPECTKASGRFRACTLTLSLLEGVGAQLDSVTLSVGPDRVLRARITASGPGGDCTLSAQATDGLVLAQQRHLPLWIAEDELTQVGYDGQTHSGRCGPRRNTTAQPADAENDPLAVFRPVIEGLDFGD